MFGKRITLTLMVGALATLALAVGPATGSSDDRRGSSDDRGRSFHGTVAGVAKNDRALTVRRRNGGRTRFVVTASTAYEHISGIDDLSSGTPVEVHAFRKRDRWIATRIEANPGGDDRGGNGSDDPPGDDNGGARGVSDDSPGDDNGGHGADDLPGDDHGSGGHGADDPPGDDRGSGGHGSDD